MSVNKVDIFDILARRLIRSTGLSVVSVLRPLLDLDDRCRGWIVRRRSPVGGEVKQRPAVGLPVGVAVPWQASRVEYGRVDLPLGPVLDVDVRRPNCKEEMKETF